MINLNSQGLSSLDTKLQQLIYNIRNSKLAQIKQNSITNLHSKIEAKIVPHDRLPIDLPSVLMQWINDHQAKSPILLKALQIINFYTKSNFGLQILKQYEALEFFEGFRQYLLKSSTGMKEYESILQNIIRHLIPFGGAEQKQQNTSNLGNISKLEASSYPGRSSKPQLIESQVKQFKQTTSRQQSRVLTPSLLPKPILQQLAFTIVYEQPDQSNEKSLFDYTVQLRYGNKQIKYQTIRAIKDIVILNPSCNFRNKVDLIKQLQQCLLKNIFQNQVVDVLVILFKGLVQSQNIYRESLLTNGQRLKSVKFIFPLRHCYLQNPIAQPLLVLISKYFNTQWLQWLPGIKYPWTFPYLLKIIKQLPSELVQTTTIQNLLKLVLSTSQANYQSLELQSLPIDLNNFQSYQIKQSYQNINEFNGQSFDPLQYSSELSQIIRKFKLGIDGLAYNPQLVEMYVEISIYCWSCKRLKQANGEYYQQTLQLIQQISFHSSKLVRSRLYQVLLEKAYSQQVLYRNTDMSVSQLLLSLLSQNSHSIFAIIDGSIDQNQSTVQYMLELLKLMYTYHQSFTHEIIKQISPIIKQIASGDNQRASSIAKTLLSRLTKKQLLVCDVICLFSKQRNVRVNASYEIFNQQLDITQYFEPIKPSKKPLIIDEDCILNYIINTANKQITLSVRISALKQLIESVRRAVISPLVQSRLNTLNQNLLKQLMEMVNQQTEEQTWMGWILTFSLQLFIKSIIKSNNIPNVGILILMMKVYFSSRCSQLINPLVGLLYVNCFKNPFNNKTQIHWIYSQGEYVKLIHLPLKQRIAPKISQLLGQIKNTAIVAPSITQTQKYFQYVYSKLSEVNKSFQLKFSQMDQLISKALLSNTPDSMFSSIRALFELYQNNKTKFVKLSPDYEHFVPPLINYLNRDVSKTLEDDIFRVIKIIGLKTQKQAQSLLNNRKTQIKSLELANKIPSDIAESIVKTLPEEPDLLANTLKLLIQKDCLKQIKSEIGLISLSSTLQKGIKNRNKKLKLYSLQGLFSIISQQFIENNSILCSIVLEQLSNNSLSPTATTVCLRILKEIIIVNKDPILFKTIEHSNLIQITINWLLQNKPLIIKAGCLGVLNAVASTPLVESYDLTTTYISQLNFIFQQADSSNEIFILNTIITYQSLSGILLLSQHTQKTQFINYILSTQLLYYIFKLINSLQISSSKLKSNYYLTKAVSSIGNIVLYLSENQDAFLFHLNKLTQGNVNLLQTLATLMPYGELCFSKMVAKIVSIWNKSHKHLDENNLGSKILNNILDIENDWKNIKPILAVSNSAKSQFISKGYYKSYLQQAMLTIQDVLVQHISTTKSKNNTKRMNTSVNSIQPIKDSSDVLQILKFFKSFFHPVGNDTKSKIHIPNEQSEMTIDILQKLQQYSQIQKSNSILVKQFKKVLSNLSSGEEWHRILTQLIDPKHSLVSSLISNCLKQNNKQLKQNFELLGILSGQSEIRTLIFRNKLIPELNSRILKQWEQRKDIEELLVLVFSFYLHLSLHQDSQQKLITDKNILDLLLVQVQEHIHNLESKIPSVCLKLLCNISYSKNNKSMLIASRQLHKTILALLTSQDTPQQLKIYLGQTLYNILFKSAQAIGIYKKSKVVQQLKESSSNANKEISQIMNKIIEVLEAQYK